MALPTIDPATNTSTLWLRVRFCETDLMGIVHHASYLAYCEAGRVEWLRRRGLTYAAWSSKGAHLPVVEVHTRYHQPARFDDRLAIETSLTELKSASLRFSYRIRRGGQLLVEAMTRLACVDAHSNVRRLDEPMLAALTGPEGPPSPDDVGSAP